MFYSIDECVKKFREIKRQKKLEQLKDYQHLLTLYKRFIEQLEKFCTLPKSTKSKLIAEELINEAKIKYDTIVFLVRELMPEFEQRSIPDEALTEIIEEKIKESVLGLLGQLPTDRQQSLLARVASEIGIDIGQQSTESYSLDPQKVEEDFESVNAFLDERTRRPQVRLQRIWNAFKGRENEVVSNQDIAEQFPTKYPSTDVANAVIWLNKLFDKLNRDLEIEYVHSTRKHGYRLRSYHQNPPHTPALTSKK